MATPEEILTVIRLVEGPFASAKPEQTLAELKADSLDRVELAMALEGSFDLVLDDATVEGWGAPETTIGAVIAQIQQKVSH